MTLERAARAVIRDVTAPAGYLAGRETVWLRAVPAGPEIRIRPGQLKRAYRKARAAARAEKRAEVGA